MKKEKSNEILAALRKEGITKVEWVVYYENDEDHVGDVNVWRGEDPDYTNGYGCMLDGLSEDDLWDLAELCGDSCGQFELDVTNGSLRRVADVYMPEPELQYESLASPTTIQLGEPEPEEEMLI